MIRWQDNGWVRLPVAVSIFNPPGVAFDGLLILNVEDAPKGVEIMDIPIIVPLPDLPTIVIKSSFPLRTITSSPVFWTVTWNVISKTLPGGRLNCVVLPATRCIVP